MCVGAQSKMVLGLFGTKSDEEIALRSSLSKEVFMDEFEKTQKTFGIISADPSGKNEPFGKIEATARFLFEQAMKVAVEAKTINSKKDFEAAAMLGVAIVHCLGRNGGMSKTQLQFLLGKAVSHGFATTVGSGHKDKVAPAISKAIIKYAHKIRQKRFRHNVEAVEENVTQFLSNRTTEYYTNLAGDIARFH